MSAVDEQQKLIDLEPPIVTEKEMLDRLKYFVDGETDSQMTDEFGRPKQTLQHQSMIVVRANMDLAQRTRALREIEKYIHQSDMPKLVTQQSVNLE